MNLAKSLEYFDPAEIKGNVHVIGCGAIGSNVIHHLVHLGVSALHIYDFDIVEPHNIANQMFTELDIGKLKIDACAEHAEAINPKVNIIKHYDGWNEDVQLDGHVFMCVDSIELRKSIVEHCRTNLQVYSLSDFRMRLTDAQYYFARPNRYHEMQQLLRTMDFTHEEATTATPTSACGVELSVYYAPNTIVSLGIANFVKCIKNDEIKNIILIDMATFSLETFTWKPRKTVNKLSAFINEIVAPTP